MLALSIRKRLVNWSVILMIFTGACTTNSRGFLFEEQVLADASAVTREYLRSRAGTASLNSAGGARMIAAANSYSSPKLLALEPCHTEVRFSYRYDGEENYGAADLDYDRTRRSWVLTRLWIVHEE